MTTALLDFSATRNTADLYRYDRTASPLFLHQALSDRALSAYEQDGFIAVADVFNETEIAEARAGLSDLIYGRVPGYEGLQPEPDQKECWQTLSPTERADRVRKVWLFCDYEPRLRKLAHAQANIQRIVSHLLGEPCQLIQDMALLKPPFIGTEKPWHQDAAYFGWGPPEKIIGVWIALDPATADNGCMHVLPGTHRFGPVPHIHDRDCQIPDTRVKVEQDVVVPLAPGGAMFFSSLVHHGTPPTKALIVVGPCSFTTPRKVPSALTNSNTPPCTLKATATTGAGDKAAYLLTN